MAHVATIGFIDGGFTNCVNVCRFDSVQEGPNLPALGPDDCSDWMLCAAESLEKANFEAREVTLPQKHFAGFKERSATAWPVITERREPLREAARWSGVIPKLAQVKDV